MLKPCNRPNRLWFKSRLMMRPFGGWWVVPMIWLASVLQCSKCVLLPFHSCRSRHSHNSRTVVKIGLWWWFTRIVWQSWRTLWKNLKSFWNQIFQIVMACWEKSHFIRPWSILGAQCQQWRFCSLIENCWRWLCRSWQNMGPRSMKPRQWKRRTDSRTTTLGCGKSAFPTKNVKSGSIWRTWTAWSKGMLSSISVPRARLCELKMTMTLRFDPMIQCTSSSLTLARPMTKATHEECTCDSRIQSARFFLNRPQPCTERSEMFWSGAWYMMRWWIPARATWTTQMLRLCQKPTMCLCGLVASAQGRAILRIRQRQQKIVNECYFAVDCPQSTSKSGGAALSVTSSGGAALSVTSSGGAALSVTSSGAAVNWKLGILFRTEASDGR